MCTVTIFRSDDRLLITMNRDERRTRASEFPPQISSGEGGPAWIGPADGEKGGTWFGANDRGMVACLLNAYEPGDLALFGRDDVPSRGEIIPRLLAFGPDSACRWLRSELDPAPYSSFTLIVATAHSGEIVSWRLDRNLHFEPLPTGWSMVTSSFFQSDQVVAWRHEQFRSWQDDGTEEIEGLPAFNLLEVSGRKEWSPFTTRSFSMTRSLTQAEIRASDPSVRLRYWRREGESPIEPAHPTADISLQLAVGS